jgi:hypothetical protein
VINSDFGGFSLSDEALELILTKKGIEFEKVKAKYPLHEDDCDYYAKGHVGDNEHFISCYNFSDDRSDPDLVAAVEELGDKANGRYSSLKIIEIPDDVEWFIAEYDGCEHVAEKHRTWN